MQWNELARMQTLGQRTTESGVRNRESLYSMFSNDEATRNQRKAKICFAAIRGYRRPGTR